jgi:hypothetical protein
MNDTDDTRWEVVATASGLAQANLIAGRLTSEGVPAQLSYEAAGAIYAITIDGLGEVRILVPAADRPRAAEILARAWEEGELPWDAPAKI